MDKYLSHLFAIYRYSTECLLSLIEFCQFEKYIMDHHDFGDVEIDKLSTGNQDITLNSEIPCSSIVNSIYKLKSDDMNIDCHLLNEIKYKSCKLFKKYIERGSELEINISWKLRNKMQKLLHDESALIYKYKNVQISDLLCLFIEAKEEMVKLLTYSHSRFKAKSEYITVAAAINPVTNNQKKQEVNIIEALQSVTTV